MSELKQLAIAYSLAQEFDYCPSPDQYKEAVEYFGKFPIEVLHKHQGSKVYELAGQLCRAILKEPT